MQCVCGSSRLLTKWRFGVPARYRDVVRHARALLLPITTTPPCFLRHVRSCSAAVSSSGPPLHAQPRNDMRDFFGCYLLTSQDPKNKGRTYIGCGATSTLRLLSAQLHCCVVQSSKLPQLILCSLYFGDHRFTVNPKRRLRQHNGEITAGAHRTKR